MSAWGYKNVLGDRRLRSALIAGAGTGARGLYTYEARSVAQQMFFGAAGPIHWSAQPNEQLPLYERIAPLVNGIGIGVSAIAQKADLTGAGTGTQSLPMDSQDSGALFVGIARGAWANASPAAPSDNYGNTFASVGTATSYSAAAAAKAGVYADLTNAGNRGQIVSAAWGNSATPATRTFNFDTDVQGLSGSLVSGSMAAGWLSSDSQSGSGGCMQFTTVTSGDNAYRFDDNAKTWANAWGVPAGCTVTQIKLLGFYFKRAANTGQTVTKLEITINDNVGNPVFSSSGGLALWDQGDTLPTSSSWTFVNASGRPGTILSGSQPASSFANILIFYESVSSGVTNVDVRIDNLTFEVTYTGVGDKETTVVVEILGAPTIADSSVVTDVVGSGTVTSNNVTTTSGAAMLLAFVWGNGPSGQLHTFTPTNGFQEIVGADGDLGTPTYLPGAAFFKYVTSPGTYNATFTGTSSEGAIVHLFALQPAAGGGNNYTASPSETVSLSDALGAFAAFLSGPAETVSNGESVGGAMGAIVGPTETVNLSDAIGALAAFFSAPAETVSISELVGIVRAAIAALAETENVTDAIAASMGVVAGPAETVSLSESSSAAYAAIAAALETVSVSESVAALVAAVAALAEGASVAEAIAASRGTTAGPSETVGLSESTSPVFGAIAAPAETVALSESGSAAMAALASVIDTVGLVDQLVGGLFLTAGVAETVNVAESLVSALGAIVGPAESLVLADALATLAAFKPAPSETVGLVELLVAGQLFLASPTETVGLSDAITAARAAIVAIAESPGLVEAIGSSSTFGATPAESVPWTDALAAAAALLSTASETVGVLESLAGVRSILVGLAETAAIDEAVGSSAAFASAVADLVTLAELVAGVAADFIPPIGTLTEDLELVADLEQQLALDGALDEVLPLVARLDLLE